MSVEKVAAALAKVLIPEILKLSPEEQAGVPVALAGLTGSAAKISSLYTEESLKEMVVAVSVESFNNQSNLGESNAT